MFDSKCARCGITDFDSLTINHIESPKNSVYDGLRRSSVRLYKQILNNPSLTKHFSLLCGNCNMLDWYEKIGYYNSKSSQTTLYYRKAKNEICGLWNYKCFKCFKTIPVELLTINHVNGGGRKEKKEHGRRSMFIRPKLELISRIDAGELEINCFNCNSSRSEYSKWTKLAKQKL